MEYRHNFLSIDKPIEIKINNLDGLTKALNRIADELEKSNNKNGKHFDNSDLLEKGKEE